jgi:glucose/arabinose dehydrogenase
MMKTLPLFLALFTWSAIAVQAQVELELAVSGLVAPVDVVHAGDDRLFIVERAGRIRILRADGQLEPVPFLDITDRVLSTAGEQGLLGLAFHPQYATNGRFYVYYTVGTGAGSVRLSRFGVSTDPDVAIATQETVLWSAVKPETNHNGGDLAFGPDGMLYLAPGDGGGSNDPQNNAQNKGSFLGKVLRLDVNGAFYSVPANNPFIGVVGALPEIWAVGLRNPWRFSFDRLTGDLWIGDVGQGAQEEVDRWPAGNNTGPNFGWRCYEGTANGTTGGCLPATSYVAPVISLPRSENWCSVIGGCVYRGALYPSLQGKYIYTDFCHGRVHALSPNGSAWTAATLIATGSAGMAAIGEDVNGELYFANTQQGKLYRLIDASALVRVAPKLFLSGAFDQEAGDMRDDLRVNDLVPTLEPYTALGYPRIAKGSGELTTATILDAGGSSAVVDWVRVELRSTVQPSMVVASCHGLLQADGDVVAADGTSPLTFRVGPGSYHVAVRHRNHLGAMTAGGVVLSTTAAIVDFRASATATWGTNARQTVGTQQTLWSGNTRADGVILYSGSNNDRDAVLQAIGGIVPTNSVAGYLLSDVNMDGAVYYTGSSNDRDIILSNIGGIIPTNSVVQQLP